jgi:hypothetical protein
MQPKKGLASSALRAQRFWDAGVLEWDGEDEFKKSRDSMNGLIGQLKSRSSLYICEADSCEDATYCNMVEEEMAMADLGFDYGWGDEDHFTPALEQYRPFENTTCQDATYCNMVEEEMAMADLGFDCGWGDEDHFTSALEQYRPFEKPSIENLTPTPAIERKPSNNSLSTGSTTSTENESASETGKVAEKIENTGSVRKTLSSYFGL